MGFKEFFATGKGKAITLGGGGAVIAIGIALAVILQGKGYRSIAVEDFKNNVTVTGTQNNGQAYVGEKLITGDDVNVADASELVLLMDGDKYVYADENTHFTLYSEPGDASRLKIDLYQGSELNVLNSKLNPEDSYEVDSPNATMAVRGTRFRVTVYLGEDGLWYTRLDVEEGEVWVRLKTKSGTYNGVEASFVKGQSALIRGNDDFSEFVVDGTKGDVDKHISEMDGYFFNDVLKIVELRGDDDPDPDDPLNPSDGSDDEDDKEGDGKSGDNDSGDGEDGDGGYSGNTTSSDPNHKHKEKTTKVIKEATCTEKGQIQHICECGEVISTETVKAKGHTEGNWVTTVEPGCTDEGKEEIRCTVCDALISEQSIPAKGHNWGNWTTDISAKCLTNGSESRRCLDCNASESQPIGAKGHNWGGWTVKVAAGCTTTGTDERICQDCSDHETRLSAAKGHLWGNWYVSKAPECTVAGVETRECSVCGGSENRDIPPAHVSDNKWADNSNFSGFAGPYCQDPEGEATHCLICGYPVDCRTPDHVWDPTEDEFANPIYKCVYCGTTKPR